tara:strand:- start:343 stop:687 length:345 start_codon:yes stop_codon:yes gene_type:complete
MAQSKANARQTLSTLFGATTSAATAIGTTFDTVTDSVEIAHEFVANAKRQQKFRNLATSADFEQRTIEEIATTTAERRAQLEKRMSSDEDFAKHYKTAHQDLLKAIYGDEETSD